MHVSAASRLDSNSNFLQPHSAPARCTNMRMRLIPFLLLTTALYSQDPSDALLRDGHYKRARVAVEARFKASPNDAETLWLMSRVKQLFGDLDAAQQFAEKAIAANPKDARFHLRLAEVVGDKAERAGMLSKISLARSFKKELDASLALDPKNPDALTYLLRYSFEAPGIVGGDKTRARAIPDEILQVDPVKGYFAKVIIARYDKQTAGFEELYRKAVEARPTSAPARLALAGILSGANSTRMPEAESHAREAVNIDTTRIGGHNALASILAAQEKWNDLDAAIAKAEKDVPDNLTPYYRAANVCLGRGKDLPRAERYFRKYLTQEIEPGSPKHADAHWRLGLVLEKLGKKADAVAELQTAVKLDSNSPAKQDLKRLK